VVGSALILIVAIWAGLLPPISLVAPGASPLATPNVLVLPVATIVIIATGFAVRMVRAGVIDTLASEYVQMARLNGVVERRVIMRHALRNALAPTVQVLALTLQWLVGGLFIIETVFGYPGIGLGLVTAVTDHDVPYIQAVALLIAAAYIAINIAADLLVVLLVPKLRTGQ
jgi:peptide/nickel transport system permease protein